MGENPIDNSDPQSPPVSSEYGEYKDALSDVLKDQARRTELRSGEGPRSGRPRMHPFVSPVLALFSIWLWVFPPAVLIPEVPSIPPASREAGLRMEMAILVNTILQYQSEHGRLPNDLQEVGDSPAGVGYVALTASVFRLSGRIGDITVQFTSTEPVEHLLADAVAIVSGSAPSTPGGAPGI